jgi:hypothetical protein
MGEFTKRHESALQEVVGDAHALERILGQLLAREFGDEQQLTEFKGGCTAVAATRCAGFGGETADLIHGLSQEAQERIFSEAEAAIERKRARPEK